jgi:hypothetical protein
MSARKPAVRSRPRAASARLADRWSRARRTLAVAEKKVEREVRSLVERSGIDVQQATRALRGWRQRLERERNRALAQVGARVHALQARARREREQLGRAAEGAVRRALAALDIPSRREVKALTRRVAELSRKIDGSRRRGR